MGGKVEGGPGDLVEGEGREHKKDLERELLPRLGGTTQVP